MKIRGLGFILFIFLAIVSGSCKKELDKIGLDIQPPGDALNLSRTDTITAVAYSVREDSVKTDKMSISLIGSYFDPVFGKTTASLFSELRLSDVQLRFGQGAVIDSIVLSIAYQSIWGDSATMQTFRVFQMTDSINIDSAYYSNQMRAYDPTELGSLTLIPSTDSVMIDTVKVAPRLRIPLNQLLADKFLNADSTVFNSNITFRQFFKGLFITADPVHEVGKGALATFNLLTDRTNLRLYYHNNEKDSLTYTFYITSDAARYSHYEHYGYADASEDFRQQVILSDTTLGNNIIYLQPLGGVKTILRFPGLKTLGEKIKSNEIPMIAVNEAKIIFSNTDPEYILPGPSRLALARITNEKGTTTLLDDQFVGDVYFGGYYNTDSDQYPFRISRYIQQRLLNPEKEDFGLSLQIPGASFVPQRVILNGGKAETGQIKLVITHTRFQ